MVGKVIREEEDISLSSLICTVEQAVILAGGRGERLRPLTDTIPKPLAPIGGIPFMDYLIQSLIDVRIRKILILVGYRGDLIMRRYGKSLNNGVKIEYSVGDVEDNTGRRLLNAYELLDKNFLLLYGDNYWPIEFRDMLALYQQKSVKALATVFSNRDGTGEYGYENNIKVTRDNFVEKYDKSGESKGLNGVDIGYFLIDKNILDPAVKENISFEEIILPKLISERELVAYVTDTHYYYITDLKSLINFESIVNKSHIKHIKLERI